ncbi:RT0821/Lpp0805 family surface protein [Pinisolibacter sp.]|uniref:RT0821/Lpp0805 family surface protein n=1 Tax=Pinisolibacter sp. TaxID=2172024 RepID=UPI002FDD411A
MAGLGTASYTAPGAPRQTRAAQSRSASIAVLLMVSSMLGGCSTIMMPLNAWTSSQNGPPADEIVTGSIRKPVAPDPEGDGEVIRRAVETAAPSVAAKIEWTNPASGNSGTISDLVEAKARNGAPCREFATTLTTIEGVALYRGRACQGYAGPWDLVEFGPAATKPAG